MTGNANREVGNVSEAKKRVSVRTGCRTCKVRHVKCDETKPSCFRCTSTGRQCDGYLPPKSWLIQINPENFEDGRERRSFQYFREQTSRELSRFYDESFWNSLAPQASQSQRAIKHCLIAISSFHERLESVQTISDASYQTEYSLQQYGKAMQLLSRAPSCLSVEETLINCILFVWFENLQNNLGNSSRHLDSGLKIIREARKNQRQKPPGVIETVLAPMFERLKLKVDAYSPRGELGSMSDREHFIPEKFKDVEEAGRVFSHLINWTCTVVGHITISRNNSDNWHQRSSKLARRLAGFDLYSARLEDLIHATRSENEPHKLQGVNLLKINDLVVRIVVSAYLQLRESAYDRHKKEFTQIVDLCHEYLDIALTRNPKMLATTVSEANVGTFEGGVLPYLLFTSAHCRDLSIRQRVVSLLSKYPRDEGFMDSHIASQLTGCISRIEKQDLKHQEHTSDCVPEANRIRVLSLSFYKSEADSASTWITHNTQVPSQKCQKGEDSLLLTRAKISFIRCLPKATEPSIEEQWIDDMEMSVTEANKIPLQLYWRQDNELLPLVGAQIVAAFHKGFVTRQWDNRLYKPTSVNLQSFLQRFWIPNTSR